MVQPDVAPKAQIERDRALVQLVRYIETNAEQPLTLDALSRLSGFSPAYLQRLFRNTFGVSPKAWQDAFRMRRFRAELRNGASVTDAILAAGFGSSSRLYGERARSLGMPPRSYRRGADGETIHHISRETCLGPLMMAATGRGVCFAQFADSPDELLDRLRAEFPRATLHLSAADRSPALEDWIDALNAHISHGTPRPDLPLDIRGTAFQIKVWRLLSSVCEGDTISYGELANRIGNPKAARAVASACAANRIGVLIPCHRVLRGDGGLGGYRWGEARKQALLESEAQFFKKT